MELKPAELLALEACAVNTRMKNREAKHRVEQRRDRDLRALLLLRASRAGATYDDLAAICEGMTERTVSNEIAEARKHARDPELAQRLPRLRSGTYLCSGECGTVHAPQPFTSAQGLAMHRNRLSGAITPPRPSPLGRRVCAVCEREISVRPDGRLTQHGPRDNPCAGSGDELAPVEAAAS